VRRGIWGGSFWRGRGGGGLFFRCSGALRGVGAERSVLSADWFLGGGAVGSLLAVGGCGFLGGFFGGEVESVWGGGLRGGGGVVWCRGGGVWFAFWFSLGSFFLFFVGFFGGCLCLGEVPAFVCVAGVCCWRLAVSDLFRFWGAWFAPGALLLCCVLLGVVRFVGAGVWGALSGEESPPLHHPP